MIPDALFLSEERLDESHKFSCVMAHLPPDISRHVFMMRGEVNPEDLAEPPSEDPHVTALYGLHSSDPREIQKHIAKIASSTIPLKFGPVSLFKNDKEDVLKLAVDSPELHALNSHLRQLPYTSSYPKYEPHVTLAILKSGKGEQYLGMPNPLEGQASTVHHLTFSTKDSNKYWLPLKNPSVSEAIMMVEAGCDPIVVAEMTTAGAVSVLPRPMALVRPIYPVTKARKTLTKTSD